jgi:hypothetical protein
VDLIFALPGEALAKPGLQFSVTCEPPCAKASGRQASVVKARMSSTFDFNGFLRFWHFEVRF